MGGNFSLASTLPEIHGEIYDAEIYGEIYNETHHEIYDDFGSSTSFELTVIVSFICVVCIFGLVGNGIVIWLLGFCMKRNPFTTYILNLAVADIWVLIFSIPVAVLDMYLFNLPEHFLVLEHVCEGLFHCFYSTSQFLLTIISIDRCVSVLFPFWYRFNRPESLSTVLCVFVWLLSFLVQGICKSFNTIWYGFQLYQTHFYAFLVNSVVCLPLITVSTLILFIRFCFKSQQRRRKKLFMVILLALFFFLIFAFPLNVIYLIYYNMIVFDINIYYSLKYYNIIEYGVLCASLNSFVNPLLYFLVGRKKRGLCRENLKFILRRVFIEEEEEDEARREKP